MIEWSREYEPNKEVPYTHIWGITPFGKIRITWKGWKEYDSPTADEVPWTLEPTFFVGFTLEDVKAQVEFDFKRRLDESRAIIKEITE